MLDPVGRRDVMETIERLNKEEGITVILITHYMDEAVRGDKVYVIDDGDLVMKMCIRDRGHATGNGTTAGRGHKGAGQRSGTSGKCGFEGGQMPLYLSLIHIFHHSQ